MFDLVTANKKNYARIKNLAQPASAKPPQKNYRSHQGISGGFTMDIFFCLVAGGLEISRMDLSVVEGGNVSFPPAVSSTASFLQNGALLPRESGFFTWL